MEFIIGVMRQISIIAVLASFLELLLPNGEMQKFIRFFMGLFILAAFLNPLIKGQLLDKEMALSEMADIIQMEDGQMTTEEILAAGEKMDGALVAQAESEIKEEVSLQILALVRLVPGVEQAAADIVLRQDDRGGFFIETVSLSIVADSGADKSQIEADIYRLLTAFYQIGQEKIQCVMKEAATNDYN